METGCDHCNKIRDCHPEDGGWVCDECSYEMDRDCDLEGGTFVEVDGKMVQIS